jgi:hypothetical protein
MQAEGFCLSCCHRELTEDRPGRGGARILRMRRALLDHGGAVAFPPLAISSGFRA